MKDKIFCGGRAMKEEKEETRKYFLKCPSCESTFDVSSSLNLWRNEFIKKIDEVIKKLKNENNK